MRLPSVIAHADWSLRPRKRWVAIARLDEKGDVYRVSEPEVVGDTSTLLGRLASQARAHRPVLVGFDFPIGVPAAYAETAGVESFPALVSELGAGVWADFYRVAESPAQISVHRPFYPQRPGGTSQEHLVAKLGVRDIGQLLRVSDRRTPTRRAACCLFWTLGGNQVGKAALVGWREILAPALDDSALNLGLWPFDGKLSDLLESRTLIVAETYPTEFYDHIGIALAGGESKRDQTTRASHAEAFRAWLKEPEISERVLFAAEAEEAVRVGFGTDKQGEDRFDAFVGVVGMLNIVLGRREAGWPTDSHRRAVEGWMLGQALLA